MPDIPGAREVSPAAEAARFAAARLDPPAREWGVRHPEGYVSVAVTGQAYLSRRAADAVRAGYEADCEWCDGGPHSLVWRDRPEWMDEGSGDASADYSEAAR
jgi:hypothetical protein